MFKLQTNKHGIRSVALNTSNTEPVKNFNHCIFIIGIHIYTLICN